MTSVAGQQAVKAAKRVSGRTGLPADAEPERSTPS
jgi:hypothetical protein